MYDPIVIACALFFLGAVIPWRFLYVENQESESDYDAACSAVASTSFLAGGIGIMNIYAGLGNRTHARYWHQDGHRRRRLPRSRKTKLHQTTPVKI
jgi:hypothetical protein